jgi:murein L,D-transpeptidase YcbB/YkuD
MKTYLHGFTDPTNAQIKPFKTYKFHFKQFIDKISLLVSIVGIFFLNTSYLCKEKALDYFHTEQFAVEIQSCLTKSLSDSNILSLSPTLSFRIPSLVNKSYKNSSYNALWTINKFLSPNAEQVLDLLNNAELYGLNHNFYHVEYLKELKDDLLSVSNIDSMLQLRRELELYLTDGCLSFMIHLNNGLVPFDSLRENDDVAKFPNYLLNSISHGRSVTQILKLQPENINYINLQKGLEKFLLTNKITNETFDVPDPGTDSILSYEKTKLVLTRLGYLAKEVNNSDSLFINSLKEFQVHHGLSPSGELTENTREALSMSTRERFNKIALNLDRLRKDQKYSNHFVFVNIPAYQLRIIKENKVKNVFNVVVGKPKTQTPILSSRIEKIVANPTWNVPKNITMNEILPKVKKDSSFLIRNNFRVIDKQLNEVSITEINWKKTTMEDFDYYFVQNSGRSNALGLLKFAFKNPYRIYIHDTPSKRYFKKEIRAYSHGCVRLQDPDQFANYLLDNNLFGKDKPNINSLLHSKTSQEIRLSEPVEIHIRYLTCEADNNQTIYFYKDIYNKDTELIETLFSI